jgi:head-tail adaptor
VSRGQYDRLVTFQHGTATIDDHGGESLAWTEIEQAYAKVQFGLAQEKREAAQQSGSQTATFEVSPTSNLLTVNLKDRIICDGFTWDITERAPLSRMKLRFTAIRSE